MSKKASDREQQRLDEDLARTKNWKRWGAYLSERQWGTVREDYSADGNVWAYFPYEMSRARAYRWGEDGLLGICDRECRLCFSLALWNGRDDHLKERLFGLTNPEGNHAEDVKEIWFYSDATPTHSYLRGLYKYPQRAFPYARLREENKRRDRSVPEFEITDTDAFDDNRYWDVTAEYAKASPDDLCIRVTIANRGPEAATLHVLPTLWFRNTWSWQQRYNEGKWAKPTIVEDGANAVRATHETLGEFALDADETPAEWLFTENETNAETLFGSPNASAYTKDAFHRYVVNGERAAVARHRGTKAAALYRIEVPAGESQTLRFRLTDVRERSKRPFASFDKTLADRIKEADAFYDSRIDASLSKDARAVARQAYAGLIWSEQFYFYVVPDWIEGDPPMPLPAEVQAKRINREWKHLFSRDVLSVPDKWEYPAFFAWDLAFHMVPMAQIDPAFAKHQLTLLLREWYLHPNGQLPAFEYDLSNVNPPVHAWACWEVFQRSGGDDFLFLERCFQKLLMNFTWWVNQKDPRGNNVFSGGFLGMDNLGVFDRSKPLPNGGTLEQADGTAWMGFFCTCMLRIAVTLARHNRAYEDIAGKFFEHFIAIADALNNLGGHGLWDETDGFYYDQLRNDGTTTPLKLRGLIGLIPLLAVHILDEAMIAKELPDLHKRINWFLTHRGVQLQRVGEIEISGEAPNRRLLLGLPGKQRLARALRCLLDEDEFLSPFGVRSLSKLYEKQPYVFHDKDGREYTVHYVPGDMDSADFGGNSNWRGPIWMPINFLLVESLRAYHEFYGDAFKAQWPARTGRWLNLDEIADELNGRLTDLFLPRDGKPRPCHGSLARFDNDPFWRDHWLFHEYFHGDNGRGLGASHQTGWTALVACLLSDRTGRESLTKPTQGAP